MTLLAWLFVCLIWSTVWLFIKLGVTDVPPFAFAATRLLIAWASLRRSPSCVDPDLALAGSIVAFWLNYWLMKRIGATRMLLT